MLVSVIKKVRKTVCPKVVKFVCFSPSICEVVGHLYASLSYLLICHSPIVSPPQFMSPIYRMFKKQYGSVHILRHQLLANFGPPPPLNHQDHHRS